MVQRKEAGVRRLPASGSTMQHWVRKVSARSTGTIAKLSVPRMRVRMMNQGAGPLKPMALNSRLLMRTGASGELVSWIYMSVYFRGSGYLWNGGFRTQTFNLYFHRPPSFPSGTRSRTYAQRVTQK